MLVYSYRECPKKYFTLVLLFLIFGGLFKVNLQSLDNFILFILRNSLTP